MKVTLKKLMGISIVAASVFLPHAQAATCTTEKPVVPLPLPYYFDISGLKPFNPNVPDGTELASFVLRSAPLGITTVIRCDVLLNKGNAAGSYPRIGGTYLYQTPMEGVALEIAASFLPPNGGSNPEWVRFPYTANFYPNDTPSYVYKTNPTYRHSYRFRFIKRGTITGAGSLAGEWGKISIQDAQVYSLRFSGVAPPPKAPTCAAAAPSQTVALGKHPSSSFKGVGTVTELKPFAINLQCSGGDENVEAKLYMTLTDNTNQSNTSNTLSLTSDSTASGLGIQVFKDSAQLGFGPDSSAAGNRNQWYAGTTGNGFFSVPLSARYVQTASTVKGGSAKGRMTFTLSYQ